ADDGEGTDECDPGMNVLSSIVLGKPSYHLCSL
uniref:Uncharacterized protein n=1 Tax=Aegilops tauschii subsp. strangulata TaxID=200361 RepID=A0A453H0H7_AEGTS